MHSDDSCTAIFFDGACPLCRAEIEHYRQIDHAGALTFVDLTDENATMPPGLGREDALARMHVRLPDGRIVSGAEAFVAIWRQLPRWRWAARLADLPGMLALLEWGYRLSLHVRPWLARRIARPSLLVRPARCSRS